MSIKPIQFLLINPTSEYWRKDNRSKPKAHTRAFRFSMYTSLCVASSVPDYVETKILDEDIEDIDFDMNEWYKLLYERNIIVPDPEFEKTRNMAEEEYVEYMIEKRKLTE